MAADHMLYLMQIAQFPCPQNYGRFEGNSCEMRLTVSLDLRYRHTKDNKTVGLAFSCKLGIKLKISWMISLSTCYTFLQCTFLLSCHKFFRSRIVMVIFWGIFDKVWFVPPSFTCNIQICCHSIVFWKIVASF